MASLLFGALYLAFVAPGWDGPAPETSWLPAIGLATAFGVPREQGDGQRRYACFGIFIHAFALSEWVQARNNPSARGSTFQCLWIRPLHAKHDVGILDRRGSGAQRRANSFIFGIGNRSSKPRAFFNRNSRTQRDKFLYRFGRRSNTGLASGGFL